jgi:nitroreductase
VEKPANDGHRLLDVLRRRWSPVAFSTWPIAREDLCSILEAARWAPSSYNGQPWHFIVAMREQPEEFQRILECLNPRNVEWARNAPVLMIAVTRLDFAHTGQPNRHAFHDIGLAVESMVIQAMSVDIFTHQMAGFSPDKARELFGIPESFEPVTAIAMGYAGSAEKMPAEFRERQNAPRTRKELADFVFSGSWGNPSPVVTKQEP